MRMRKGFTLIELLIVLAIIAALMAVVTPIALNAVRKAKVTNVAENLRNIKAAVESYVYTDQISDFSSFDIETVLNAGYLTNLDTSKYEVAVNTHTSTMVEFFAYYKDTDVTIDELDDILPQATDASHATDTSLGGNYPGLLFDVALW